MRPECRDVRGYGMTNLDAGGKPLTSDRLSLHLQIHNQVRGSVLSLTGRDFQGVSTSQNIFVIIFESFTDLTLSLVPSSSLLVQGGVSIVWQAAPPLSFARVRRGGGARLGGARHETILIWCLLVTF